MASTEIEEESGNRKGEQVIVAVKKPKKKNEQKIKMINKQTTQVRFQSFA